MPSPKKPIEPKVILDITSYTVLALPPGVTPYPMPTEAGEEWKDEAVVYPTDKHGFIYLNNTHNSMGMRSATARLIACSLVEAANYLDGI